MYKNCGAKIKGIVTVLATLGMVGAGLTGIVLMIEEDFLLGLVVAVAGMASAWLAGLMMAAFGELVQNTYEILQILKGMKSVEQVPAKKAAVPYAEVKRTEKTFSNTEKAPEKHTAMAGECLECGSMNKPGSLFCFNCGSKL